MLQSVLIFFSFLFFSTNPCLGIQYVSWNEIKLPQYSDGKPEWNTSKTLGAPVWWSCALLWFDEDLTHVGCCISRCNHYQGPSSVGGVCPPPFPSSEFKLNFSEKIIPLWLLTSYVDQGRQSWSLIDLSDNIICNILTM